MNKLLITFVLVMFLSACTSKLNIRKYQVTLHSQDYLVKPTQNSSPNEIDEVERVFRKYREFLISKHIPNYSNDNPNTVTFRIFNANEILPALQRWSGDSVLLSYSEDEGFHVRVEERTGEHTDENRSYFAEQLNRSITEITLTPVHLIALPTSQP